MEILPLDTVFTPGTRFEYGGLAMQIAGRMAEKAMNKEFEELFQKLIARPLGMKSSHFTPVNTDGGHAPMLGGGLCTTLHDYMRFLDMIYHNGVFEEKQILKPETIHEMQADQVGNAEVHPGEYVERALKNIIPVYTVWENGGNSLMKQQEKPIRSVHRVGPAPIHGSINRAGYMDSS